METFSRETLHPWYVTGFTDGEGSFTFSRSSKQIALYFSIKLSATDRAILEAIQSFFGGIGRIYNIGSSSVTTKKAAFLRVTRIAELAHVVSHFDTYPLQTEKKRVFEVWRNMYELKRDFRNANREMLEDLAIELSSRAPRNQT